MENLITIPNFNTDEVRYILKVESYINDVYRGTEEKPTIFNWARNKQIQLDYTRYYSKFIYKSYYIKENKDTFKDTVVVTDDPLVPLNIILFKHPKLNLKKFIIQETETYTPPKLPINIDSAYHIITYLRIREPIVSFLEQTIGLTKEVTKLKKLFSSSYTLSFDEYLNKKSEYLINLNLNNYINQLNEETEKKRKIRIEEFKKT